MALSRIRRTSLEDMAAFIDQKEADVLEVLANEIPERQQFDALNSAIEELNCIRDQIVTDGICRSTALSLESIRPDAIPRGYTVNSFTQHHSRIGLTATMEAVDGVTIGLVVAAVAAAVAIMIKLTQWVIKKWKSRKDDKYLSVSHAAEEADQNGIRPDLSNSENVERLNRHWNKAVQQALEPNSRSLYITFMTGFSHGNFRKAVDGISAKIDILDKSIVGWGTMFKRSKDMSGVAQDAINKAMDNTAINELGRAMNWLGTGSSKDFDVTVEEAYKQFNADRAVTEGAPQGDWAANVVVANKRLEQTIPDKVKIGDDLDRLNEKLTKFQTKLDAEKNSKDDTSAEANKAMHDAVKVLKRQVQTINTLCMLHLQYYQMFGALLSARNGILGDN